MAFTPHDKTKSAFAASKTEIGCRSDGKSWQSRRSNLFLLKLSLLIRPFVGIFQLFRVIDGRDSRKFSFCLCKACWLLDSTSDIPPVVRLGPLARKLLSQESLNKFSVEEVYPISRSESVGGKFPAEFHVREDKEKFSAFFNFTFSCLRFQSEDDFSSSDWGERENKLSILHTELLIKSA